MDFTRFLDSLEVYVDRRIALSATDENPQTNRAREDREAATDMAQYARDDLLDELRELFK